MSSETTPSEVPGEVLLPRLGLSVTPMTAPEVVEWISAQPRDKRKFLLNHNLHSSYLFQKSRRFREFYAQADRVIVDGMPILVLARKAAGHSWGGHYRIGSTDWLAELHEAPHAGRLFVCGASEDSNQRAVAALRDQLSTQGWVVDGVDGYQNEAAMLHAMTQFKPSLVIVGLGMPIQEKFLAQHLRCLPPAVYATVGGAIDYVAGVQELAPRWVGRMGVEWLWRLSHDPLRLSRRYLIEPIQLILSVLKKERERS